MNPGDICVITELCAVKEWHGKRVRLIAPSPRAKNVSWRAIAIDALPHGQMNLSRDYVGPYLVGDVVNFPNTSLRVLDPQPVECRAFRTLREGDTMFVLRSANHKAIPEYVTGSVHRIRLGRSMLKATLFDVTIPGNAVAFARFSAELASALLGTEVEPLGVDLEFKVP